MLSFYLSMLDSEEDKQKFEKIYFKYRSLMYSEARKFSTEQYVMDDIVHDTFVDIIQKIKKLRYDNDKEFASLVCTMTRHCGAEYMRKNKKYVFPEEMPEIDKNHKEADREKVAINSITLREVMKAIEEMNPMYAEPLKLKMRGYSSDEIGRLLDISPQNARIRIHRAKKIIIEKLGDING